MNVQTLLELSAKKIGADFADYSAKFDDATTIVMELARLGIGVNPLRYRVVLDGTEVTYTPTDTDYKPVALPTDLTADSQIIGVSLCGQDTNYFKTETHSGSLYLLVPYDYTGAIEITYSIMVTPFTSLSDELPIENEAGYTVACFGVAWLFALNDANEYTNDMLGKYEGAKANWRRRDYSAPNRVRNVYDF